MSFFTIIPRENFLPEEEKVNADLDIPLPIGYGQTNSQPTTVRMMLEWLGARPGNKILDIGSGSGWTSALLSQQVGPKGRIVSIEKVPELVNFGRDNCRRLGGLNNIEFYQAGKVFGWPQHAPYDRILVSASATELPSELIDQLSVDGKMVIPVGKDILVINKDKLGKISQEPHSGFVFVPLVKVK